ncbi:hypothetical protein BD626DRAFT_593145 [Schizophyllum amplum]|uniref:MYND-type domain-containing protein n=1 Tax=Schizophyllum amplum TaxID=97359 RepID=A0A550CDG0_9AGAR|nr:hypothetical protein BD626DRAFT_593145 [Auriculariopsis ampla]
MASKTYREKFWAKLNRDSDFPAQFRTALLEHYYNPVPLRFLRHPVVQEMFSRLRFDKIPTHPLKSGDKETIKKAIQALFAYDQLVAKTYQSTQACVDEVLAPFPDIWKWIMFLLPGAGNVRDMPTAEDSGTPSVSELDTGEIEMGVFWRCFVYSGLLASLMGFEPGRKACLSEPEFAHVCLSVLAHSGLSYMATATDSLHRLVEHVYRLLQDKKYSARVYSHISEYDERHPGIILHVLVDLSIQILDGPDASWQKFIPTYITFSKTLLASETAFAHFRDTGGMRNITTLLSCVLSASATVHAAYRHALVVFGMNTLRRMATSGSSNRPVIDSIRAGLLLVFRCILQWPVPGLVLDDKEIQRSREVNRLANDFVHGALLPALVWPGVSRAFQKSLQKTPDIGPGTDFDEAALLHAWPELAVVLALHAMCYHVLEQTRESLVKLEYCHNTECSAPANARTLKMCACAEVMYCSKACQKAHWRHQHRTECNRGLDRDGVGQCYLVSTRYEDLTSFSITHFERHYLKEFVTKLALPRELVSLPSHPDKQAWLMDLWRMTENVRHVQIEDPVPSSSECTRRIRRKIPDGDGARV